MRPSRRFPEPVRFLALALPLGLLLTACGGAEEGSPADPAAPTPVQLSTAPPTPTAPSGETAEAETADDSAGGEEDEEGAAAGASDPGTWATFTEEPGMIPRTDGDEVFADDPRVVAVRTFNEEFARAATAGDPQSPGWLETLDPEGYDGLMAVLGEEFGKQYPGPLPFSVIDVTELEDGSGSVQGCLVSEGFAMGPEGVTGSTVTPIEYALSAHPEQEGAWLVQAMWAGAYDCSAVDVEGTTW